MDTHEFFAARKACKNVKERVLLDIGREKDELLKLAQRAVSGDLGVLRYAEAHIRRIEELKRYLREKESEEDPVQKFKDYIRPWDHECDLCQYGGYCPGCPYFDGEEDSRKMRNSLSTFGENEQSIARERERQKVVRKRSFKVKKR